MSDDGEAAKKSSSEGRQSELEKMKEAEQVKIPRKQQCIKTLDSYRVR